MRFSLPASTLLHGGLLAWALVGFAEVKPLVPAEPEPVEVAMITEDGLTRLRQGDRNSKNLETAPAKAAPPSPALKPPPANTKPPDPTPPPPPPPEPAKAEPPAPPPPKAAEAPPPKPPEPQKDEIAELALKAEAEAKAEAERKAAEERKRQQDEARRRQEEQRRKQEAERKKREEQKRIADAKAREEAKKKQSEDFFDDMQKALKDNDPRKRAPQQSGPQVAMAPSNIKGPAAGAPEGLDAVLTASQSAMLGVLIKNAVKPCFNIDAGADGVKDIVVRIAVQLRPDGTLSAQPRVMDSRPGPLYAAVADAALRAVQLCGPYKQFPPELYKGGWDNSVWRFEPGQMF